MLTTDITAHDIDQLRAAVAGDVVVPGDETYESARMAWNLTARQRPAVVVVAQRADDILAAVLDLTPEGRDLGEIPPWECDEQPSSVGIPSGAVVIGYEGVSRRGRQGFTWSERGPTRRRRMRPPSSRHREGRLPCSA